MDEFDRIMNDSVSAEFANLTKIGEAMTARERMEYQGKFPPVIWQKAGPNEEHAYLISMN